MKRIGILTSGGDAPGMNACIRSVVRSALNKGIEVYGFRYGYDGLIGGDYTVMESHSVSNILQKGGTILKSSRSEAFRERQGRKKAMELLKDRAIDGIVVIGGDGTFTGASIFGKEFEIPIIGIPATIDNDLYGTDATIGFDTAVNTALGAIDNIRDTAISHDRVFFIEVMGRSAGHIAINCSIGGGAELVITPEIPISNKEVIEVLSQGRNKMKTSSIVVVAEGNDQMNTYAIAKEVRESLPNLDIRVSTLGHIQRGGRPTSNDRILATRLGNEAVEGLIRGKTSAMVGQVDNKIVFTSFSTVLKGGKTIDYGLKNLVDLMNI